MDIRHLETFAKIAELKSFTKAAEILHLTQPTASKQILDLERFFDVRLLDRTKRSVALTKAGEILLKHASDFLLLKKETIDAIAAFKGMEKGVMVIGASTIPGTYVLPWALNRLHALYGGIQLKLIISDTTDVLNKTDQGEIDIGFVGAKDEARKADYHRILEDAIVIVAPSDYPDSIQMQQLKDYPMVAREEGSGTRNAFELAVKALCPFPVSELKTVGEFTGTQAIKEAVRAGMGIAYISRMAIKDELAHRMVKLLSVEDFPEIKRTFYTVTKRGKTPLPQTKALMDILDKWGEHAKD